MCAADRRARGLRPTRVARVTPSWSNEVPWERERGAYAPDCHPGAAATAAGAWRKSFSRLWQVQSSDHSPPAP